MRRGCNSVCRFAAERGAEELEAGKTIVSGSESLEVLLESTTEDRHRWAVLCSLIETCKLNDVEPDGYLDVEPYGCLKDVLQRMVDGYPVNRLDELLPWAWKAENLVKH